MQVSLVSSEDSILMALLPLCRLIPLEGARYELDLWLLLEPRMCKIEGPGWGIRPREGGPWGVVSSVGGPVLPCGSIELKGSGMARGAGG